MISFALNHIWQSTCFAAVIALLALAVGRHSANVRFWLWMSASFKFLVPFAFLAVLGSHLPRRAVRPPADPPARTLIKLAQPFASVELTVSQLSPLRAPLRERAAISPGETWAPRLVAFWLFGFTATLACWFVQTLRLARTCRAAQPAHGVLGKLPIPVLLTDSSTELGVFGIFRPVLLLPAGIAARLSPAQLQAVVAHELVHVQRRDNLWAALHAFVQSIFWFNPLVWWMGGRLVAEREQACDEAVLAQGADAEGYAASILAVCRHYACPPRTFVVGVAGADLNQRISSIMRFGLRRDRSRIPMVLAALAAGAVLTPIILGRAYGTQSLEAPKPSFDVASIHEWGPGKGPTAPFTAGVQFSTGRVRSQCASLMTLVFYAYELTGSERIEGLPKMG